MVKALLVIVLVYCFCGSVSGATPWVSITPERSNYRDYKFAVYVVFGSPMHDQLTIDGVVVAVTRDGRELAERTAYVRIQHEGRFVFGTRLPESDLASLSSRIRGQMTGDEDVILFFNINHEYGCDTQLTYQVRKDQVPADMVQQNANDGIAPIAVMRGEAFEMNCVIELGDFLAPDAPERVRKLRTQEMQVLGSAIRWGEGESRRPQRRLHSFGEFFGYVAGSERVFWPLEVLRRGGALVAAVDAPNPFPGLLSGKEYGRLASWPDGAPDSRVPLIWDEVGPDGKRTVLFLDGAVTRLTPEELQKAIEHLRQYEGREPVE